MRVLDGEATLMRIFLGENDRHGGRPLHEAIVQLLRKEGFAGATVLRGVVGFGAKSVVHRADVLRLSSDLPILVEAVETADKVEAPLPKLDDMLDEGLVTLEKVRVVRWAPK